MRRKFLKSLVAGTLAIGISPAILAKIKGEKHKLKLGLISDLHQDIVPDGMERLKAFLSFMQDKNTDALVQMGDFAIPKPENRELIQLFNTSQENAFHVLGNHDIDGGYSWEDCLNAYGMESPYYSLDLQGIRILVLDGNETGSPTHKGGYPSYIGSVQQEWLKIELEKASLPVLIISHQPIAGIYTIDNAKEMQDLLGQYSHKILLAINGHAHVDQHVVVQGVNYVHINSASYYWVGENLAHLSYPKEVHEKYPSLASTCPYSESLFALLTIDLEKGIITIEGRKAKWIGPSPQELGIAYLTEQEKKENLIPEIQNREIRIL